MPHVRPRLTRVAVSIVSIVVIAVSAFGATQAVEPRKASAVGPSAAGSLAAGPFEAVAGTDSAASDSSGAVVVDWNRELLQIVQTPGAQPATVHPTRSFALLHAAIYDAVVSVQQNAVPYLFSVPVKRGASAQAAAAEAGHAVLSALYPAWKPSLNALLSEELAKLPGGDPELAGMAAGDSVASILLAVRADDGSQVAPAPFVPGTTPGAYRSTPPNFPAAAFTNWGTVRPFVLDSASQFRPAAPPDLTSAAYAAAVNEVETLGSATSTARTADQTVIGKFWAPPIWNTWNSIAETQAIAHHANLERTAALFAALDLSFADATIGFYDAKYHYLEWRPVSAIRLAGSDGNPATVPDAGWLPLANTAPDPSYPGAHSTISAAGAEILASFFGERDSISVTSPALAGVTRSFRSYADVATEAGLSRIYAGQHFRFDHVAGLALGKSVADFVLTQTSIGPNGGHDADADGDGD